MLTDCSIFAFLHIKCFTYKVYVPDISTIEGDLEDYRTPRLKSLGHAMNPMETFRELWAGTIYIFRKWRGKETDKQARRVAAHQGVFGHSRSRVLSGGSAQSESLIHNSHEKKREKQSTSPLSRVESGRFDEVLIDVEREVYIGSERQWLGAGESHHYILGSITREKSEDFEDAIARELYKRGYTLRGKVLPALLIVDTVLILRLEASRHNKGRSAPRDADIEQGHVRGGGNNQSWWRSIYQRVSQSSAEDEQEKHFSPHPKRKSVSRPRDSVQALPLIKEMSIPSTGYAYEDPPPPSTLNAYRSSRFADNEHEIPRKSLPRASPPASNFARQSPDSAKPKANPPVQLGRSDSLLGRIFAYLGSDAHATNTDLGHGTESQPSRPSSLWRAGGAKVVPKHVPKLSSVAQANISNGVDTQPVTPVRGNIIGTSGNLSQGEETPIPPLRRSRTRDMAERSVTTSQQSPPVIDHSPSRYDPPVNSPSLPHPPGIPESNTGHDFSSPLPPLHAELELEKHIPDQGGHIDPRIVYPIPIPDPRLCSPPQKFPFADPSSPPNLERPRRASRNEALLRPFPEPVYHPPPNTGLIRFTPPRSKLTVPVPLAKPLPRGSGNLKRNRTNTLPNSEQCAPPNGEPYWESRSRRHSQPVPVPRRTTDPRFVSHHPTSPSRNPHPTISQSLPLLQETSQLYMSPPSSPPQRSSRRLSSPLMSVLPNRPTRSNAVHRKSPGPHSPTRATSPRTSLLAELRGAPEVDSDNLSRYPMPGPGPGTGSPPRISLIRPPPSPRTPPFVNTHMLPSPTNSPRNDAEEWASAISSFPPSVRTMRS